MCWRQWHLCRSSPPSQTCEEHITNRVVRDQGRPGTLDITPCAGLGRWQRAAVYISQYALFPSSPVDIRYNTAFWITYDNFIACKRRVNRVIRIFIGSTTIYMNNNKTLFFPCGVLSALYIWKWRQSDNHNIFVENYLFCEIVFYPTFCSYCALDVHSSLIAHKLFAAGWRWCTEWQDGCIVFSALTASPHHHQVWCV